MDVFIYERIPGGGCIKNGADAHTSTPLHILMMANTNPHLRANPDFDYNFSYNLPPPFLITLIFFEMCF